MSKRPAADSDRRRKLTEEGWEALHLLVETDTTKKVREHCTDAKVSLARYYQRYPVKKGGGEVCDYQPPSGFDPGNTRSDYPRETLAGNDRSEVLP